MCVALLSGLARPAADVLSSWGICRLQGERSCRATLTQGFLVLGYVVFKSAVYLQSTIGCFGLAHFGSSCTLKIAVQPSPLPPLTCKSFQSGSLPSIKWLSLDHRFA